MPRNGSSSGIIGYDFGPAMDRPHTWKEIAKITAGAVASLVIVGWIAALALAFLSVR